MKRGIRRSSDFRFSNDLVDFLGAVNRASVIYKVELVEIDDRLQEVPDIRFNLHKTANEYEAALESEFTKSCDEIEQSIDESYAKTEKLSLLARYIVEIESLQRLLFYTEGSGFVHKKFSFTNISNEEKYQDAILEQRDFQDYYFWMDHYLKKMHAFLLQMKMGIELTSQVEFKVPLSALPSKNGSSIEKPIRFFDFLFLDNGIAKLRREFIPNDEDRHYYSEISYDPKTEVITTEERDKKTGQWETRTFAVFLQKKLDFLLETVL
ncbi:MAG: hypothetical protein ACHQET_13610 [Chitinophagales bacterium]